MLLSIQRFVSFYKGKGDKSGIKGTILGALKISLPMGIIFVTINYLLIEPMTAFLSDKRESIFFKDFY